MSSGGEIDIDLVSRRRSYLAALSPSRVPKAELVDRLDDSRSTVNRAVAELTRAGLAEDLPGGCRLTVAGQLAATAYGEFRDRTAGINASRDLLDALGPGTEVGLEMVTDAAVEPAHGSRPYRAFHVFERLIEDATHIRGAARTFAKPRAVDVFEEAIVDRDAEVEFFFDERLFQEVRAELAEAFERWQTDGEFIPYLAPECPPYTILASELPEGPEAGIAVYTQAQAFEGVIVNDAPEAVRWAHDRLDTIARTAMPLEAALDDEP